MITQPLKWHGGKHYLAKRIIAMMPPHLHYVEPYAGGLAVLLQKDPEGVSEVVNDLNGELINFWRVLQSRDSFEEFRRIIEVTPFAEDEWEKSRCSPSMLPVIRAVQFFVRYRQSRQGLGRDFATLSRNRTRRGMNEQVSSWLSAVEGLPEAHERLRRVVILNRDALDVIRQQDGPNTLFYLDPPYLHETRETTSDYECEMSEEQHVALLSALKGIKGKFMLSGYHSSLYDGWARDLGFACEEIEIDNKASGRKVKQTKIECVWRNF